MRTPLSDTIAAISTPLGESGIGIVRISGSTAVEIADNIIELPRGERLETKAPRTISYGVIVNTQEKKRIDEALITVMRAPYTYTKEDVVEINCHGGTVPLRKTLELTLDSGARLAEPGEFTKRAFLNGRIDLAQAEAVIDVIRSKTDTSLKVAAQQLEGRLSRRVESVREYLLEVMAHLEAAVDFSDEDVEVLPRRMLAMKAQQAGVEVDKLLQDAGKGKVFREGVRTAIVGKPNVGKSSLLNALLNEKRAIVTSIPGTTRDVIEETISIRGVPIILQDTAGIRHPKDEAEQQGAELSRKSVARADLIIFVVDTSEPFSGEDLKIAKEIEDKRALLVLNKVDLQRKIFREDGKRELGIERTAEISATKRTGLEELEQEIVGLVFSGRGASAEDIMVTNVRHQRALKGARAHIAEAEGGLSAALPEEVVATVLKDALDDLGEIVGKVYSEDLLDRIFSQFCIGK